MRRQEICAWTTIDLTSSSEHFGDVVQGKGVFPVNLAFRRTTLEQTPNVGVGLGGVELTLCGDRNALASEPVGALDIAVCHELPNNRRGRSLPFAAGEVLQQF